MRSEVLLMLFLCIVFLFLAQSCKSKEKYPYTPEDFRPELQEPLQKIASRNTTDYLNESRSEAYIREHATQEELLQIIQSKNSVLRAIGFDILVARKDSSLFSQVLTHLSDTATVEIWSDDVAYMYNVADYVIDKSLHKLTQIQKDSLANLLLYQYSRLQNTFYMLEFLPPQEQHYRAIRQLAQIPFDGCNQERVLIALARYKKIQDIELLSSIYGKEDQHCWFGIFRSIEQFPEPAFFPVLQTHLEQVVSKNAPFISDDIEIYCRAVAAYQNAEVLQLLETILQKNYSGNGKKHVFQALHKHLCPIYQHLYNQLKPQMDPFVIKYADKDFNWERSQWNIW
ncbi:hypothetical protein [Xanthocytophaga agilis]|uniref:Uncharacterized protein n=1 Tax=Xanthocytophaga agilis TaxID=3048010 RepID=A0AAE3UBM2_9BACT|nr:hypothetical protein [Xanthocytophaga agilis]MDJ1499200.1 hypothetical protein [Xanthocytophaga agilis]